MLIEVDDSHNVVDVFRDAQCSWRVDNGENQAAAPDYGCGTGASRRAKSEPDVVLTPVSCLYSDGESFISWTSQFEQFSVTEEQLATIAST